MLAPKLDEYRTKLRSLASRLGEGVRALEDEALRPTGSQVHAGGEADPGAETAEEELARTLLGNEGALLADVNAALERIEGGTFGRCEACGHAIAAARLDALPYARRCIACARSN